MATDEDQPAERLRRQQDVLAEFGLHAFRSRDLDELLGPPIRVAVSQFLFSVLAAVL